MAVICSGVVDDELLKHVLNWLNMNEKGAYLTKIISRIPAASSETRHLARQLYLSRENIEQH